MKRQAHLFVSLACSVGLLLLSGCQPQLLAGAANVAANVFVVDQASPIIAEPGVEDWTTAAFTSPRILARRAAKRRQIQAFSAPANWNTPATGVALSAWGVSNDHVPNGPATVYETAGTPATVVDTVFHLTKGGKFIRVKKNNTGAPTVLDLDTTPAGNQTFSQTYITLSPAGGRAYLVSDEGTFLAVNTDTMAVIGQDALGAGACQGLAPVLDPVLAYSSHSDAGEDLYVPVSNGEIVQYRTTGGATPGFTRVFDHNDTGLAPRLWGNLSAPPIAFNNELYFGDTSGNFIRYNVATRTRVSIVPVGYAVLARPALELDASGTKVQHAFVNAGAGCTWIQYDLVTPSTTTSARSRPLYVDESDVPANRKFAGNLAQYAYSAVAAKYWIPLEAFVTINTPNPQENLGNLGSFKTTDHLTYAEMGVTPNTRTTTTTDANSEPSAVTVAPDGRIWVTENNTNPGCLTKLNADGSLNATYNVGNKLAVDVAVDSTGVAWVARQATSGNLVRIGTDGTVDTSRDYGTALTGVTIGAGDTVWTCDRSTNLVKRRNADNTVTDFNIGNTLANDITYDPVLGNIWVTREATTNNLVKIDAGGVITTYNTMGAGKAWAVACDGAGNPWVCDYDNGNVYKFAPDGTRSGPYAVGTMPNAIDVDANGDVWVTSEDGDDVFRLSSAGAQKAVYSEMGDKPTGVAVDANGVLWLANFDGDDVSRVVPGSNGPAYGFMRFNTAGTYLPTASNIIEMSFFLKPLANQKVKPPFLRKTDHLFPDASGLWDAAGMTPTFMPTIDGALNYTTSPPVNVNRDRANFTSTAYEEWKVNAPGAAVVPYVSVVMRDENSDDHVNWPFALGGAIADENGNAPASVYNKDALRVNFDVGSAADPGVWSTTALDKPTDGSPTIQFGSFTAKNGPYMMLRASGKSMATVSITTPPTVDVFGGNRYVYVLNGNAVFRLNFNSAAAWEDVSGVNATQFYVTRNGNWNHDATSYGPTYPSAAGADQFTQLVTNRTAPLLSNDGAYLFVIDRYPTGLTGTTPNQWRYALNKIKLPFDAAAAVPGYDTAIQGDSEEYANLNASEEGAAFIIQDAVTGRLHFGLPSVAAGGTGKVYQVNHP